MKKIYKVFGSLTVAIIVLGACNSEKANIDPGYDVYTQKTTKAINNKIYKIGETVELDGVQITIDKAYFTKPSKDKNAYNGNVLTVDLQVWSKPYTRDVYVEASDFYLYDLDGEQKLHYHGYIGQEINAELSGEKEPDNDVTGVEGSIYFDTAKNKKYILVYKPPFSKKIKEIKFGITPK